MKRGKEQDRYKGHTCSAPGAPSGTKKPEKQEGQRGKGYRRPDKDIEGKIFRENGEDADEQPMDDRDYSDRGEEGHTYGKQPAPVPSDKEERAPGNSSAKDGPI
ncbi:hypothetical protein GCM10027405_04580 [Arthrobacter alkaliphilus]